MRAIDPYDTSKWPVFAIDYETYYDDDCSIAKHGARAYFNHPDFDAYMVTIVGEQEGQEFVGRPEDFDWSSLPRPCLFVSHNAGFDEMLTMHLVETGKLPEEAIPDLWECTADMSAYLKAPRSLKEASAHFFGIEVSKETRDSMKGKRWEDMTSEFQEEVSDYAMEDSRLCLRLWLMGRDSWPWWERCLSRLTRYQGWAGVPLSEEKLDAALRAVQEATHEAYHSIPWTSEGHSPLSTNELARYCRAHNIPVPSSVAVDSEEANAWEAEYGAEHSCLRGMRTFRSLNALEKKLESMKARFDPETGRMNFGKKYAGAHTLRWSGDAGVNIQNLPRGDIGGINIRSLIEAPDGHMLIKSDLSQIEPRCVHALIGDTRFIEEVRKGGDLYERVARLWGLYDGPEGEIPYETRQLVKTCNLGLQYLMSPPKFAKVADIPLERAQELHALYHDVNPLVKDFGDALIRGFAEAAVGDGVFEFALPLRSMVYQGCSMMGGGLHCTQVRQGRKMRVGIWPGLLIENLVQALARDVFATKMLQLAYEGVDVLFSVHDEVVCLVTESEAEETTALVQRIMSSPVSWLRDSGLDIPLAAETKVLKFYRK